MNLLHIPFHTLGQRHLVYAYCVVWLFQFGYATYLAIQWRASRSFKGQG
jgi:hypothetical protein